MEKFGKTEFDGKHIYAYGNIRLVVHYYNHILKPISQNRSILDIGCGDGIIGTIVEKDTKYLGIDIGAGIYDEIPRDDVVYIRDYQELLEAIDKNRSDITILANVLEHTFNFTDLFEKALENSNEYCFVALPNEENIHARINFCLGKGLKSHNLNLVGRHVNHRHLWLIQPQKAENILKEVASRYGFELEEVFYNISFPSTPWKRVIYKTIMMGIPWRVKCRNVAWLFKKA